MSVVAEPEVREVTVARVGLDGRKFWLALVVLGLLAVAAVVVSAYARMAVNTDGTAYYGTARNVMAGQGPLWPYGHRRDELRWTVHFPPLFALAVGHLSSIFGVKDPHTTVTWLHGLLMGATVALTGWMVRRHTRSGWWGLGGAVFLLLTVDMLDAHAAFMSEPLFIFLGLAGLVAVDSGARQRSWAAALGLVFLGGVLIGASCWCRYAGIAFIAAAGLGLLLYPGISWQRRLALAAVAGAPMVFGWWSLSQYVYFVLQASTSRVVRFQPDQLIHIGGMLWYMIQWVLPVASKFYAQVLGPAGCLLGAFVLINALRRQGPDGWEEHIPPVRKPQRAGPGTPFPMVFACGAVLYGALMVFSAVCVDPPATPFEARLLVPWLPTLVVFGAWGLQRKMAVAWRPEWARMGIAAMLIGIGIGNWPRFVERFGGNEQYRVGYTSTRWEQSGTAKWVRENVPENALIFCNRCDALYYLTDRTSVWIPQIRERGMPRSDYDHEVKRMCEEMGAKDGFLICFNEAWAEDFGRANPRELKEAVKEGALVAEVVTNDGAVYRWKRSAGPATTAAAGGGVARVP